jgi:16S rRNA (guanine966-N2)-methyltransferase
MLCGTSTCHSSFDLIYIAPPQYKNLWVEAMQQIAGRPEVLRRPSAESGEHPTSGLAIVQIDPKEYESLDLGEIREMRQKRYGNSLLVFFELGSGSASDSQSGNSRDVATRPESSVLTRSPEIRPCAE